jgi:hypothetical protein
MENNLYDFFPLHVLYVFYFVVFYWSVYQCELFAAFRRLTRKSLFTAWSQVILWLLVCLLLSVCSFRITLQHYVDIYIIGKLFAHS